MKTLLLLLAAVTVVLGAAGCATQSGGTRASGYNPPGSIYGSKVFR